MKAATTPKTEAERSDAHAERTFVFTTEEWAALASVLDAPVEATEREKVARLLSEKPPWSSAALAVAPVMCFAHNL